MLKMKNCKHSLSQSSSLNAVGMITSPNNICSSTYYFDLQGEHKAWTQNEKNFTKFYQNWTFLKKKTWGEMYLNGFKLQTGNFPWKVGNGLLRASKGFSQLKENGSQEIKNGSQLYVYLIRPNLTLFG